MAMAAAGPVEVPKNFRTVIVAASVGNVIEWYDFYIFGSLATVLAVKLFEKTHRVAALRSTIALFIAGIVVALAVVLGTRGYFGEESFNAAWGAWRIPFLVSFLLVAVAIYIRLQLGETPIFQEIKAKGLTTKNPWKEAFLSNNIQYVVV